jgi:hypothetical protein
LGDHPWDGRRSLALGTNHMKPESAFPDLSETHRRGIGATLKVLDEVLCGFERWAEGREVHSVLYSERNSLSAEQRDNMRSEIADIRETLAELRNSLRLEGTIEDVTNIIRGECAVLWSNLVELESTRLRRYGPPPPGLARYLDPKIAKLIAHVNGILETVSKA